MFPAITSPRGTAADSKRRAPGMVDAAANHHSDQVSDWTPHDVAEWLYTQGTKDDYAHTFLVHGIDGQALLGLTRERLADWKVKAVDCATIMKGVQATKPCPPRRHNHNCPPFRPRQPSYIPPSSNPTPPLLSP